MSECVRTRRRVGKHVRSTVCGWVRIDNDVSIRYDVCGNVVEFDLGDRAGELQLLITERGLANLIATGTEALDKLRAGDIDE